MCHRRLLERVATLCASAFLLACASASPPPASRAHEPSTAAGVPSSSVSAAGSTSAAAVAAPPPVGSASQAPEPTAAESNPPCIDGEIMMGACICSKGKGADATGHCVYPPCPKSKTGGTSFRDESTGQCKECRAGLRPSSDGTCQP